MTVGTHAAKDQVNTGPPTFEEVLDRWPWRPIPRCPGRYKLPTNTQRPEEIVGAALPVARHRVEGAKDTVLVIHLRGGGLISYERADGTILHTLGDNEGFLRKLGQLGLS